MWWENFKKRGLYCPSSEGLFLFAFAWSEFIVEFVYTFWENLTAGIEEFLGVFFGYMVFLFQTQQTFSGSWPVWGCSPKDFPLDLKSSAFFFQCPNVIAQLSIGRLSSQRAHSFYVERSQWQCVLIWLTASLSSPSSFSSSTKRSHGTSQSYSWGSTHHTSSSWNSTRYYHQPSHPFII